MVHDVHGHGQDDGGVVLGGDAVKGLEITELEIEGSRVGFSCALCV